MFAFLFLPHATPFSMSFNGCSHPGNAMCACDVSEAKIPTTLPAPRPRPSLSTASTLAPAARSRSTTASRPNCAARCNGVSPRALEERCLFWKMFLALLRRRGDGSWWRKGLSSPCKFEWLIFYLDVDRKGSCVLMRWFNSITEQATLSKTCHCRINLKHP